MYSIEDCKRAMIEIMHLDKVRATFNPKRTDDLVPGVEQFIGREGIFQAHGDIEHGPYKGQQMMRVPEDWYQRAKHTHGASLCWVPEEDLEVIEVVQGGSP